MGNLKQIASTLIQRSASNANTLTTNSERLIFSSSVKADIASIINQINNVYYPLVIKLMNNNELNALDYGLSGNIILTDVNASAGSATVYWDEGRNRGRTVKESLDVVLTELVRLEGLIDKIGDIAEYDDSELLTVLDLIKSFIGFSDQNLTTTYSNYGSVAYLTDGISLEESLWTLDSALNSLTLNSVYAQGGGNIELTNASGELLLNGDGILSDLLSVKSEGIDIFKVSSDGVNIYNVPLTLKPTVDTPTSGIDEGKIYSTTSSEGTVELNYLDNIDRVVPLTKEGRVVELEMGCQYISAANFTLTPGSPEPHRNVLALGSIPGNNDIAYDMVGFLGTGSETCCYINLALPVDMVDDNPMHLKALLYTTPRTNTGAANNLQYTFTLKQNGNATGTIDTFGAGPTGTGVIAGESIQPAWSLTEPVYVHEFDCPGELNLVKVATLEFNILSPSPYSTGLISFRLSRNPGDSSDTYTGEVAVLGIMFIWQRHSV